MLGGHYTEKMIAYQQDMERVVLEKVEKLDKEGWENYVVKAD